MHCVCNCSWLQIDSPTGSCMCVVICICIFVHCVCICTVFVSVFGCRLTGRVHYSAAHSRLLLAHHICPSLVHFVAAFVFVCLFSLFVCFFALLVCFIASKGHLYTSAAVKVNSNAMDGICMRRSVFALMECDSAVTGLGQDVRRGKGSPSCNYRRAPCQRAGGAFTSCSALS